MIKFKGCLKNPFFYLGLVILILLGALNIFTGPSSVFEEGLVAVSQSFDRPSDQIGFLEQKKNIEPLDLNIIQENSLTSISSPTNISFKTLGVLVEGSSEIRPDSKEIIEYLVQSQDTLISISKKFGISLDTILWANNLNQRSVIRVDQKLIILPISGVLYQVKKDDTLSEIAKTYKGKIQDIISFNDLSGEGDIFIGDTLIIPNGAPPARSKKQEGSLSLIPLATKYFIYPTVSHLISQGLHWRNAIDFDGDCGDPIYAAAQGTVLRIRFGWNMGAGNYLTILHPNGVVTMYGHLQSILVKSGDNVSQGQLIAYMGGHPGTPGAGKSTGCHLHFGVYGARNPFAQ